MTSPLKKIRVMLSSRNKDLIPSSGGSVALENVRKALQKELQDGTFCGQKLLDIWINEAAGAAAGTNDAWQECMDQVDAADLVIAIYNGEAGWTRERGGVGICHAEFQRAWSLCPSKLRLIWLQFEGDPALKLFNPMKASEKTEANRRFKTELETLSLFRGSASDDDSLKQAVRAAIAGGVADLARTGSREGRKGKFYLGSPLDWSRMSYSVRKAEIEKAAGAFLLSGRGSKRTQEGAYALSLGNESVLLEVHGVPAGFGVAEARELVGRPYLRDHRFAENNAGRFAGPLHVLACHKKCTESQVTKFMGHPDIFLVSAPFGFFAADQTSFVQVFFLTDCRDEISTRLAFQRLFDWIEQAGETERIIGRARSRARILTAVAEEVAREGTP
jgi:hypothetical protein